MRHKNRVAQQQLTAQSSTTRGTNSRPHYQRRGEHGLQEGQGLDRPRKFPIPEGAPPPDTPNPNFKQGHTLNPRCSTSPTRPTPISGTWSRARSPSIIRPPSLAASTTGCAEGCEEDPDHAPQRPIRRWFTGVHRWSEFADAFSDVAHLNAGDPIIRDVYRDVCAGILIENYKRMRDNRNSRRQINMTTDEWAQTVEKQPQTIFDKLGVPEWNRFQAIYGEIRRPVQ